MSSSNSAILPQVHASGIFRLKEPFQSVLTPNVWYTCIAVRKLEELKLVGLDAFDLVYRPKDIDRATYDKDYQAGVSIITVKSSSGDMHHFPSSYLLSFPVGTGELYSVMGLAINLGSLPVKYNLDALEKKIKEYCKDTLGVEVTTKPIQLSQVELVSQDNHRRYEAARANAKTENTTDRAKLLRAEEELTRLRAQVREYERWILAKNSS